MPAIASEPVSVRAGDGSSLFWLSLASGSADVLSFVELGNLFTSAMTGNAALLALAIGRGQWLAALRVTCALVSFALGVSIATVYAARRVDPHAPRAFRRLLRLELAFLGGCAALWSIGSTPLGGGLLFAVIALSAVSMGIQAVGARIIDSAGISTVVFTSVLVRIVMSATGARMRRDPVPESPTGGRARLGTFAAYGCGGILAAVLSSGHLGMRIWVPFAAVVLAIGASALSGRSERLDEPA